MGPTIALHGPTSSRSGFAAISEVWTFSKLERLKLLDRKMWIQGHINRMISLLNLKKIYQLFQNLLVGNKQTEGQTEYGDFIGLSFPFSSGK
jgi:hypothetical protein